jgi:hypothetical protein
MYKNPAMFLNIFSLHSSFAISASRPMNFTAMEEVLWSEAGQSRREQEKAQTSGELPRLPSLMSTQLS